jgi:hypothetical protein
MKLLSRVWIASLALIWTTAATAASYVVLQESEQDSLVRVSADGTSVTTIARGVPGVALAIDAAGNYIVASKSAIFRVTREGQVTHVVDAPSDSQWAAVGVSPSGDLLVADGCQPAIWTISPDGASMRKTVYPNEIVLPCGGARRSSLLVEPDGSCVLLIGGWETFTGAVARFYRMSRDGEVAEIPLSGPRTRAPEALTLDGAGNYLFVNEQVGGTLGAPTVPIMRLTHDGVVSKLTDIPAGYVGPVRMIRNSGTGDIIVSEKHPSQLLSVRADGSASTTLAVAGLTFPVAVVEDSH